jgi:hypothetical protein
MNVYNRYYKQVKECPPSGTTEEEWYKIAADNYRDAEGHAFAFIHCVEVLHQLPKFNPMIDDADRSSDVVIARGQGGVGGDVYVVLQRKTSTIVVDETMQNVWRAIIRDVLRSNKTCMICSKIVFGVSYLYSKVELVNAFRINSSLKWSKLYSNRVSNIISECS